MTVYEVIRELPDIDTVRDRSRALAMLDAILVRAVDFRYFSFDSHWASDAETALMQDGSGDDYSITFSSAGAFGRGFDHESPMSPYRATPLATWPGLVDKVPAVFRRFLAEPAFTDPDGTPRATVCFWRELVDAQWQCGAVDIRSAAQEDVDGASWMFNLLTAGTAEAYQGFAEGYGGEAPDLAAIHHVYGLKPLTQAIVAKLNPAVELSDLGEDISSIGYPV
jgi:hypothetical protein